MPTELKAMPGVVEMIHGIPVADPYRWLEDRGSLDTERWIAEQRARYDAYFQELGSLEPLRSRISEFVDVETVDQIGKVRDRYFYRRRDVGRQQASIFVSDAQDRSERVLVDPSGMGPYTSVGIHRISPDGSLLAYELKQGGEHSSAIYVVEANTGTILPDHLDRGLARGFVFRNANDGFYYCHDLPNDTFNIEAHHAVLLHRLGTSSDDDRVLLRLPRDRSSKLLLKSDGQLLAATLFKEEAGRVTVDFYVARQDRDDSWRLVCEGVPAPFIPFVCCERLLAHRCQNAPNGEIVEIETASCLPIRVIVPEWQVPIKECIAVKDRLYLSYLVGTETVVRIWSANGDFLGALPLECGYTWRFPPRYADETDEFFLQRESFNEPGTLFSCRPPANELSIWSQRHAPSSISSITAGKVTYASKDGTEVLMTLVGQKDSCEFRDRPVIMTAYGGFGMTMTPQFSVFVSSMMELGFLFALPQIRGGGERGRDWHESARRRNRPVAFDDFIRAAEWLCEKGLTNPQKLAVFGGSNSGILVGAAITRRPDLFRAALFVASLLDMVRYHLFDRARVWAEEYGTADDPDDFRVLLGYSPYHQIRRDQNYPAALFICGDKDTRCNPAHSRKMAARLGDRPAQEYAILLDHSAERGHSPTMPLSVRVDSLTHRIAFLCHELGVPIPQEAIDDPTSR
jgi:prolyl oligopeptidase